MQDNFCWSTRRGRNVNKLNTKRLRFKEEEELQGVSGCGVTWREEAVFVYGSNTRSFTSEEQDW